MVEIIEKLQEIVTDIGLCGIGGVALMLSLEALANNTSSGRLFFFMLSTLV